MSELPDSLEVELREALQRHELWRRVLYEFLGRRFVTVDRQSRRIANVPVHGKFRQYLFDVEM